jgi:hypothetical protein
MSIYQKVFSSKASHFGALAVLSFSLALTACDKGSYDDLPENTGNNNTLTGIPPESGELLDQNIGLDGRWETYCERKHKYIFEIKGSEVKKIHFADFEDGTCTQPRNPETVERGFTYTFTLKPPITTPSGLTAYPIDLVEGKVSFKDLIVLHENKLYWQEQNDLSQDYPVDIDIPEKGGFNKYHEFHRVE